MIENLYTIRQSEKSGQRGRFTVRFNPECAIYKGHFAGNPITPGACILEIMRRLASTVAEKEFSIREVKNIKYLALIDPLKTPEVDFIIELSTNAEGETACRATVGNNETAFVKSSMILY